MIRWVSLVVLKKALGRLWFSLPRFESEPDYSKKTPELLGVSSFRKPSSGESNLIDGLSAGNRFYSMCALSNCRACEVAESDLPPRDNAESSGKGSRPATHLDAWAQIGWRRHAFPRVSRLGTSESAGIRPVTPVAGCTAADC